MTVEATEAFPSRTVAGSRSSRLAARSLSLTPPVGMIEACEARDAASARVAEGSQRTRADAGQENDNIELAGDQPCRELLGHREERTVRSVELDLRDVLRALQHLRG